MILSFWLLINLCFAYTAAGQTATSQPTENNDAAEFPPLIERYILDELKSIRQEQLALRAEIAREIAAAKIEATDRSVNYATSTLTNIFYMLTAATVVLALFGWSSLRDVRSKINEVVENRVNEISEDYEARLSELENRLKTRSEEIIEAQEQIALSSNVQSLWMRSGLESSLQAKIDTYDQILRLRPEDVDALSYKADAALDLGEPQWALNLINRAISANGEQANAFWKRACIYAVMEQPENAIQDIRKAVELSPSLADEIKSEPSFENIKDYENFVKFLNDLQQANNITTVASNI